MEISNDEAFMIVKWAENVANEHNVNVLEVIRHFDCNFKATNDVVKSKNDVEKQMRRISHEEVE